MLELCVGETSLNFFFLVLFHEIWIEKEHLLFQKSEIFLRVEGTLQVGIYLANN